MTYPIALPAARSVAEITLRQTLAVQVAKSPFTKERQVYKFQGEGWEADISLVAMRRDRYEMWNGFLMELDGPVGTFLMGDPNGSMPRGTARFNQGVPVVKGGAQINNTLDIDGLPLATPGYLRVGDYFQLGTGATARLYKLLRDVDTNGAGEATLFFWPRLRSSPADNAPLIVRNAVGLWSLVQPMHEWKVGRNGVAPGITFQVEEPL